MPLSLPAVACSVYCRSKGSAALCTGLTSAQFVWLPVWKQADDYAAGMNLPATLLL